MRNEEIINKDLELKEESKELLNLEEVKFSDILQTSISIQENCQDFIECNSGANNIRFSPYSQNLVFKQKGEPRVSSISKFGLGQLCTKLGIPSSYLFKCLQNGYSDLVADNLNTMLASLDVDFLFREHQGKIRGVLSPRYSIFDTPSILNAVSKVLDVDEYNIKGFLVTPERLHLRLVSKQPLPVGEDDVYSGIMIDSSDVGRSTLRCRYFIYKLVCTNGLMTAKSYGDLYRQKHVGIESEDFLCGIQNSLSTVDLLNEAMTETILTARNQKYGIEDFEKYVKADPRVPVTAFSGVKELIMNGTYQSTKWGVTNALTQVAQNYTLETRLGIEKYAGNFLGVVQK